MSLENKPESPRNELVYRFDTEVRDETKQNEDAVFVSGENGIAVICDGYSQQLPYYTNISHTFASDLGQFLLDSSDSNFSLLERMLQAYSKAYQKLIETENISSEEGSACTSLILSDDLSNGVIGHIGDTRLYIFKNDSLLQLTEDHKVYNNPQSDLRFREQARDFVDTLDSFEQFEQASEVFQSIFRRRNVTTKSIRSDVFIQPQVFSFSTENVSRILMTTNGIHDNLTQSEIENVVRTSHNPELELIDFAFDRSRSRHVRAVPDDMSAIVIDLTQTIE